MKICSDQSNSLVPSRAEIMDYVLGEAARLLRLSDREIRPDSDLTAMMDSLDAISMLLALNQQFDVDLEEAGFQSLRTPEFITNKIVEIMEGKERLSVMTQST